MSRINLLPWREQRRKEQQKEFTVIAALVGLACLVAIFLAHVQVNNLIQQQQQRNNFLQNEIRLLDLQIAEIQELEATRRALVDRMTIIQELQTSRPLVVRLFDELVNTLPGGTHLTGVTQRDNNLEVTGRAESNARVSAYMRNLEDSPWFAEPVLLVIETREERGVRLSDFRLTVRQASPGTENTEASR
ncbi:PilN domain-containing protein [Ectothiorhodospira lacustris]|uniref:PilN domain-containing protein n=1 Tax=Ectothiorhodospira lacustris TaxID=2899127 RepID=UPI001EE7C452|nr:PilN domain-containing protein [Ectothiorhodospira lacustris]MCG5501888.1 PilN domain-containing protein [Ectothiorhodospira lacustris]MCG5509831.1 PilN domain-containing protein [Ectothiorhodospira lacustris]MCG5521084.1 PilN domain-containing protein [Ectothiorhodospira lacustris]